MRITFKLFEYEPLIITAMAQWIAPLVRDLEILGLIPKNIGEITNASNLLDRIDAANLGPNYHLVMAIQLGYYEKSKES